MHAPGGIRTSKPNKRVTADPRRRPVGHWDPLQARLQECIACLGDQLRDVVVEHYKANINGILLLITRIFLCPLHSVR